MDKSLDNLKILFFIKELFLYLQLPFKELSSSMKKFHLPGLVNQNGILGYQTSHNSSIMKNLQI